MNIARDQVVVEFKADIKNLQAGLQTIQKQIKGVGSGTRSGLVGPAQQATSQFTALNKGVAQFGDGGKLLERNLGTLQRGFRRMSMNLTTGNQALDLMAIRMDRVSMAMWKFTIAAMPFRVVRDSMLMLSVASGVLAAKAAKSFAWLEVTRRQFVALKGSIKSANVDIEYLRDQAPKIAYSLQEVVEAGRLLTSAGYDIRSVLHPMADLSAGINQAGLTIVESTRAFVDAMHGEFRRLKNTYNISEQDVFKYTDAVTRSQFDLLSASERQSAILIAIQAKYPEANKAMMEGLIGSWSNFRDTIQRFSQDIGKHTSGTFAKIIDHVSELITGISKLSSSWQWMIGWGTTILAAGAGFVALWAAIQGARVMIAGLSAGAAIWGEVNAASMTRSIELQINMIKLEGELGKAQAMRLTTTAPLMAMDIALLEQENKIMEQQAKLKSDLLLPDSTRSGGGIDPRRFSGLNERELRDAKEYNALVKATDLHRDRTAMVRANKNIPLLDIELKKQMAIERSAARQLAVAERRVATAAAGYPAGGRAIGSTVIEGMDADLAAANDAHVSQVTKTAELNETLGKIVGNIDEANKVEADFIKQLKKGAPVVKTTVGEWVSAISLASVALYGFTALIGYLNKLEGKRYEKLAEAAESAAVALKSTTVVNVSDSVKGLSDRVSEAMKLWADIDVGDGGSMWRRGDDGQWRGSISAQQRQKAIDQLQEEGGVSITVAESMVAEAERLLGEIVSPTGRGPVYDPRVGTFTGPRKPPDLQNVMIQSLAESQQGLTGMTIAEIREADKIATEIAQKRADEISDRIKQEQDAIDQINRERGIDKANEDLTKDQRDALEELHKDNELLHSDEIARLEILENQYQAILKTGKPAEELAKIERKKYSDARDTASSLNDMLKTMDDMQDTDEKRLEFLNKAYSAYLDTVDAIEVMEELAKSLNEYDKAGESARRKEIAQLNEQLNLLKLMGTAIAATYRLIEMGPWQEVFAAAGGDTAIGDFAAARASLAKARSLFQAAAMEDDPEAKAKLEKEAASALVDSLKGQLALKKKIHDMAMGIADLEGDEITKAQMRAAEYRRMAGDRQREWEMQEYALRKMGTTENEISAARRQHNAIAAREEAATLKLGMDAIQANENAKQAVLRKIESGTKSIVDKATRLKEEAEDRLVFATMAIDGRLVTPAILNSSPSLVERGRVESLEAGASRSPDETYNAAERRRVTELKERIRKQQQIIDYFEKGNAPQELTDRYGGPTSFYEEMGRRGVGGATSGAQAWKSEAEGELGDIVTKIEGDLKRYQGQIDAAGTRPAVSDAMAEIKDIEKQQAEIARGMEAQIRRDRSAARSAWRERMDGLIAIGATDSDIFRARKVFMLEIAQLRQKALAEDMIAAQANISLVSAQKDYMGLLGLTVKEQTFVSRETHLAHKHAAGIAKLQGNITEQVNQERMAREALLEPQEKALSIAEAQYGLVKDMVKYGLAGVNDELRARKVAAKEALLDLQKFQDKGLMGTEEGIAAYKKYLDIVHDETEDKFTGIVDKILGAPQELIQQFTSGGSMAEAMGIGNISDMLSATNNTTRANMLKAGNGEITVRVLYTGDMPEVTRRIESSVQKLGNQFARDIAGIQEGR